MRDIPTNSNFRVLWFAAALMLAGAAGCALTGSPPPPPSIADTDQTLASPMRPKSEQKYQWWEFQSILDPRSRDIESHLGY